VSTHNFFLLTICNFLSEFRQNFAVSAEKLQLLALPIFHPRLRCSLVINKFSVAVWTYIIVLSH